MDVLYSKSPLEVTVCETGQEQVQIDHDWSDEDPTTPEFNDQVSQEVCCVEYEITSFCNIRELVDKVRTVVRLFRKSPTKMDDALRKRVNEQCEGKDMCLILDSRTRWNSLLAMLQRFHLLKKAIGMALIDVEAETTFTTSEWMAIESIIKVLAPIETTVLQLCNRNSNLLEADVAIACLLDKGIPRDLLGMKMIDRLTARISERRTEVSDVLCYLGEISSPFKPKLTEKGIHDFILKFYVRSAPESTSDVDTNNNDDYDHVQEQNDNFANILQKNLQIMKNPKRAKFDYDLKTVIFRECEVFQIMKEKGKHLKFVYESLRNIQCATVEAERTFSTSGRFVNKLRSRLSDEAINSIIILKSRMLENKRQSEF